MAHAHRTTYTAPATIPMAYTYNGQPNSYSTLRGQILEFVKAGSRMQAGGAAQG